MNLLSNAIKFTPSAGEVELQIETLRENASHVTMQFRVRDTGLGMDQEQIKKLFSPFTQADSSTSRQFGGTGLGLSICQRLVGLFAGEIWVESKPNQGSTFFVQIEFERLLGHQEPAPTIPDSIEQLQIMVISEQPVTLNALEKMIQTFGFIVHGYSSTEAAIESFHTNDCVPQLIVVESIVHEYHGSDIIKQLRTIANSMIPSILLLSSSGEQSEIREMDAVASLLKPATYSSMLDAVLNSQGIESIKREGTSTATIDLEELKKQLSGMQVLLVEDNRINQQIAQELLQQVGIVVDTAHNGQKAVSCVAKRSYQLILMDIQMPIMDGYQATQQIRSMSEGADIPIIAMTAHAMNEERDRCLAIGMNEHLTKPIDRSRLYQTLLHWLVPSQRHEQGREEGSKRSDHANGSALLPETEPKVLDQTEGLGRLNGNLQLYQSLLREFQLDYATAHETLAALLMDGDEQQYKQAYQLAHNVKGIAANLGAHQVVSCATKIDEAIQKQHHVSSNLLMQFQQAMLKLLGEIETSLFQNAQTEHHDTVADQVEIDITLLRQQWFELITLLEGGRIEAQQRLDGLLPALVHMESIQGEIAQLQELMERFQYRDAAEKSRLIYEHII
jgi:CheY-like chemotaxis protein